MNIFQAVVLGILQGVAEFLPISSSGHLVLFGKILGIENQSMTFDIMLHIATLIPVCIVYREKLLALIRNPMQKMTYLLIVGTIPAVIAALLFDDIIESFFEGGKFLSPDFFFSGIILLLTDRINDNEKKDMTYKDSLVIGIMQAIAIIPGISRSGSTIAGALYRKLDRTEAAQYSFLLSVIAVLGAAVLAVKDILSGEASAEADKILSLPYISGFIAAALSGYLAIQFMLKLINECKLRYFSIYVFALGILILY
ncbi:MAG: undecaprenyl-diphosphate phosphatase [Firmicutes bacterium]|nr:undecaprenyl-diphosphate phosphatase [Bacillota bacterium]